jgi:hypothetical protein
VKSAIGKAWAKFFHTEVIPDAEADNPYFFVACKETQRWGKLVATLFTYVFYASFYLCITHAFFCR